MTPTMLRHTYGVQVGNETYSVVATDEDWEKRRLERDKQKKLSQETNRRRKALEERKKVAEEREARKRALQLSKRRQRQTEATEKYQRAHLPPKPANEKTRPLSANKNAPKLDDVLQQLRSGSAEIDYAGGNDEQNNASTQQMNYSRAKFESKLKEEQQRQRLLQEHKKNTEKEFYNEIGDPSPTLDRNSSNYNVKNQEIIERRNSYGQIFSNNIDLMSGQTIGAYHTLSSYPSNRDYLPESVAKLFVKNEDASTTQHSSHIDINQLHLEDADDVMQNSIAQPKISEESIEPARKQVICKNNNNEASFQDDQDSLHGSSSSGTSPVMPMTSFHRKYADDIDYAQESKSEAEVQSKLSTSSATLTSTPTTLMQSAAPIQTSPHSQPTSQPSQVIKSSTRVASPITYPTWTHQYVATPPPSYQEAHVQSSYATTMASNYYVKSFRPSSAVESKSFKSDSSSAKPRPKSAIVQHTTSSESVNSEIPQAAKDDTKALKFTDTLSSGRNATSFAKPNATPISVLYSDAWKKPEQSSSIFAQSETTFTPKSSSFTEAKASVKPFTAMSTKSDSSPSALVTGNDSTITQPDTWSRKTSDTQTYSPVKKVSDTAPVVHDSKTGFDKPLSSHADMLRKVSLDNKEAKQVSASKTENETKFKGILRKVSKYDAPMYHTAAVAARKKWVEHITATTGVASTRAQSAKLADTEVRDSLEVNKNGNGRPKSVRWHEIHYDDGTSATLADMASSVVRRMPPTPPSVNAVNRPFRSVAVKSLRNRPSSAKPKPKPPNLPVDRSKMPPKNGRARKFKMPNKSQASLSPHPPVNSPQQRTSSVIAQAASGKPSPLTGGMQSRLHETEATPHRIAWGADERNVVTMENLKSSGSPPPRNQANGQSLSDRKGSPSQQTAGRTDHAEKEHDSSFNLSKTPTDQEINWLWDKVRSCISQRPDSQGLPISKTLSDTGHDRPTFTPSSYRQTSNGSPPRASVVSIDGGMFVNNEVQSRSKRLIRPSSAVIASAKQRLNTYNASIRRQALLQQRRNKQFGPNRMKQDLVAAPRRYPTPRMSYFDPLPSPSGRTVGQVDESTTAFLLAETLAEQNMSEDQILKAMESLQRKTREAQSHKAQMNPNALSIEEQRLLKSLERLNMRLHEVETATATNPNMTFFKHTQANMGSYSDRQFHAKDIRQHRRSSARY